MSKNTVALSAACLMLLTLLRLMPRSQNLLRKLPTVYRNPTDLLTT